MNQLKQISNKLKFDIAKLFFVSFQKLHENIANSEFSHEMFKLFPTESDRYLKQTTARVVGCGWIGRRESFLAIIPNGLHQAS